MSNNNVVINNFKNGAIVIIDGDSEFTINDKMYLVEFFKRRKEYGLINLDYPIGSSNGQSINKIYMNPAIDDTLHLSCQSISHVTYNDSRDIKSIICEHNKSCLATRIIRKVYCSDGSIIDMEKEMNNMKQINMKKVQKTNSAKETLNNNIKRIATENKETILSIFSESKILENFASTLIDNIDEFLELVDDNEVFISACDNISTLSYFYKIATLAGRSNKEIIEIINNINNSIKYEESEFERFFSRKRDKNDKILNAIINARREHQNVFEWYAKVFKILSNSKELKNTIVEGLPYKFNTLLGYMAEDYIIQLALDKKFVFSIVILLIDECTIEKMEKDIAEQKSHISKLSNSSKDKHIIQTETDHLKYLEDNLSRTKNNRTTSMARLFKIRKEIDKIIYENNL